MVVGTLLRSFVMKSPAKILLSAVTVAALMATPALAKPQKHQASVSQAGGSHAPIADNSTFLTIKTHVFGADFDPTVRLIQDHQPDGYN
jgi:hypothetical protein